jgi:hypothetical protein
MAVIEIGRELVLVSVSACALDEVFTVWLEKVSDPGESAAVGRAPVPVSAAVCGEPLALSAIETKAALAPVAVGEKVTLIAQLPPAVTVEQLFVCPKSAGFDPVTETEVTVRLALPVFESVTCCDPLTVPTFWAENPSDEGESEATGICGFVPVPARLTVCGVSAASSATEMEADFEPAVVGAKLTLIVQDPLETTVPQVFVWENCELSAPVIETEEIESETPPPAVTVIV